MRPDTPTAAGGCGWQESRSRTPRDAPLRFNRCWGTNWRRESVLGRLCADFDETPCNRHLLSLSPTCLGRMPGSGRLRGSQPNFGRCRWGQILPKPGNLGPNSTAEVRPSLARFRPNSVHSGTFAWRRSRTFLDQRRRLWSPQRAKAAASRCALSPSSLSSGSHAPVGGVSRSRRTVTPFSAFVSPVTCMRSCARVIRKGGGAPDQSPATPPSPKPGPGNVAAGVPATAALVSRPWPHWRLGLHPLR